MNESCTLDKNSPPLHWQITRACAPLLRMRNIVINAQGGP